MVLSLPCFWEGKGEEGKGKREEKGEWAGILWVFGLDYRRSVDRHRRRCARIGRPFAAVLSTARQRDCVCLNFIREKKTWKELFSSKHKIEHSSADNQKQVCKNPKLYSSFGWRCLFLASGREEERREGKREEKGRWADCPYSFLVLFFI